LDKMTGVLYPENCQGLGFNFEYVRDSDINLWVEMTGFDPESTETGQRWPQGKMRRCYGNVLRGHFGHDKNLGVDGDELAFYRNTLVTDRRLRLPEFDLQLSSMADHFVQFSKFSPDKRPIVQMADGKMIWRMPAGCLAGLPAGMTRFVELWSNASAWDAITLQPGDAVWYDYVLSVDAAGAAYFANREQLKDRDTTAFLAQFPGYSASKARSHMRNSLSAQASGVAFINQVREGLPPLRVYPCLKHPDEIPGTNPEFAYTIELVKVYVYRAAVP